jgi:hypothetical protein
MDMRGFVALCIIAFFAGLGIMVGNRMSSEAVAVVVGVVCGVLAGIPTSVLMLVVMRARDRRAAQAQPAQPQPHHYPPVIVVSPGGPQQLPSPYQSSDTVDGDWRALGAPRREFRIIGEDE